MPHKMNAHDVSQFQNNQPAGYTMVPTPHQDYYNSEHHGYLSVQDIPSQLIPNQGSSEILQHGSRHRKLARNSSFPANSKHSSVYGENNNQMNFGHGGQTQRHPSSEYPSRYIPGPISSEHTQLGPGHRKLARNSSLPTNSKQSSVRSENNNQMNLGAGGLKQRHSTG
eukprot:989635_1